MISRKAILVPLKEGGFLQMALLKLIKNNRYDGAGLVVLSFIPFVILNQYRIEVDLHLKVPSMRAGTQHPIKRQAA
jgi:hypothetical protein